ncbi:MAG: hypothetical protein HY552_03230 [Elusimicrobia bacterium]|nr:hypothetical protein [Elusimicrobiota bacterium]
MRPATRAGLAALALLAGAAGARAQEAAKVRDAEAAFLGMSKLNLGAISSDEDRKYLYTIQLEKARLTRRTLRGIYENAFDLYRSGQFEAANELTRRILAIDPGYEDAAVLHRATLDLKGASKPMASERRLLDDRFEEGLALYRQGRLVEAAQRWDEVVKLSPTNFKARYWLRKARGELAAEHVARGRKAYAQHRLRETLDQWYAALVLNPRYPGLTRDIAKVEAEAREQDANEKLQTALNLYSQGRVVESLRTLDAALEVVPGNVKAQKLQAEIRAEVANQHVAEGRRLYEERRYDEAVKEWKQAVAFGFSPKAADQLVARAREAARREEAERRRAAELAQKRAEEAKQLKEEQAAADAKKKEEEQKAAAAAAPSAAAAADTARQQSQQAYLAGVIFFQKGDYEKARDSWLRAKQLDPSNSDAAAGLEKIEQLYGGGR